ncbi:hypothetical protein ABIA39_001103 [Nocardia sp. GAS34]|uniref:hypothetical protein n=1 Tax=unclassified Nocardia TaxID=2637762 RepID=UPI003D1E7FEC
MAVVMVTDLLRQFGDLHLTQGAMTQTAGAIDQAATIAAAVPVFGPIGSEFLAAYACAQANHARAVTQLTDVYESTGAAAHAGAVGYDLTEVDSAVPFAMASADSSSLASSAVSSTAAPAGGQLASVAAEVLQVAGEGVGLAATVGGEVAHATQQAQVNQQAAANQQAQASEQAAARAGMPGAAAPAVAGAPASAITAGPAPATVPDRAQPAQPGHTPSAAPESNGIVTA